MSSFPALGYLSPWTVLPVIILLFLRRPLLDFAGFVAQPFTSGFRHVPGPKSDNFLWGHIKLFVDTHGGKLQEEWIQTYGKVFAYRTFFGGYRLCTSDTRATTHILGNFSGYCRPSGHRMALGRILGEGLAFAEGDTHRRQNPSFSLAQIRMLTPMFFEKSDELRDILLSQIDSATAEVSGKKIDMFLWLSRVTLDIIGLAGFDYPFNALSQTGEENALSAAFTAAFDTMNSTALSMVRLWMPALRFLIPDKSKRWKRMKEGHVAMDRIGKEIVEDKKLALAGVSGGKDGGLTRSSIKGRDILSNIIKANMAVDAPESQKLTDDEVQAQISTFMVSGHETISASTAWTLLELASHPRVQAKLRDELRSVSSATPTMDELIALPYLDFVIREALRLRAVVHGIVRVATQKDVVPTAEPWTDKYGVKRNEIVINKGDTVVVSLLSMNLSRSIWGEDALEFKPERWASPPPRASEIPGIHSNIATFSAGPRACIGYKIAIVEMKVLLFTLIRAFAFETIPGLEIRGKSSIVNRPFVASEPGKGYQLPLSVKPVRD
ncbi:hypothetical protein BOTBODRAFT_51026 [Botryobasidium botryosum FD-172 SS1]|uniref:Cytochrome P450 n=1 Tax=Botryobasidium botryosum (strain FD-172 SS1) TaxID=930990 RepID=A0A067MZG2_BOTB1|nr:hypothetical protein BOTBODRAFT_51026 [Botryobasidium botryosum FD-172 SS1]